MDQAGIMAALMQEAQTRGMGQPASNVGTSPNPSVSQPLQQTSPSNPMQSQLTPSSPSSPSNPLQGQIGMMNKAQPNESQIIVKALIKRLNDNQPENPKPQITR